jgi:hypothetical protein
MVDQIDQKPALLTTKPLCYKGLVVSTGIALFLTACATTPEPRVVTKTVNVAIPMKCDPQPRPQKPTLPDYRSAPDIFEGVKRLIVRDKLHTAYEGELEAALSGCEGEAAP